MIMAANATPAASAFQSMAAALCPNERTSEAWHAAAARRQYIDADEAMRITRLYLVDGLHIPQIARLTGRAPDSISKHIRRVTGMPSRAAKRWYAEHGWSFSPQECGYQKPGRRPSAQHSKRS